MDKTSGTGPQMPGLFGLSRPMTIVLAGSILGLLLLLVGVIILFRSLDIFLGGVEEWRKYWYVIGGVLLFQIAGLGVLFVTLQMLRTEERQRPWMRRLVYGYNTILAGLLLFEVLAVINFLAYTPARPFSWLNTTYDWTENRQYTLGPKAREFLGKLDKKVTIKVMLPEGSSQSARDRQMWFVVTELNTLLDQMQWAADPKMFVINRISPDHMRDVVDGLVKQYSLPERRGVLLIYGTAPDEMTEFIPYPELTSPDPDDPTGRRAVFNGEQVILSKLSFLARGKKQPVIYFTQGSGELDLKGMQHFEGSQQDEGMGILTSRLEKENYIVKPLRFDLDTDKVPEDADLVVVARPTRRLPPHGETALLEYMGLAETTSPGAEAPDKKTRKGKMIVLFDIVTSGQQTMVPTLEDFVKKFGADVEANRLVTLVPEVTGSATTVLATGATNAEVPYARFLRESGEGVVLSDVRTVKAGTAAQPGLTSHPMLEVLATRLPVVSETNLAARPSDVAASLRRRENAADRDLRLLKSNPLVAVSVDEEGPPSGDPTKAPNRVPRMIVMGDASWVSNRDQLSPWGEDKLKLFVGCLSWLGEQAGAGLELDAKKPNTYRLKNQDKDLFWKLATLPMAILTLGILGLGLGVWVIRRR